MIRSGFIATFLLLALAMPIHSEPLDDGYLAYERGDYAIAIKLWRPLAEQGHAESQVNFGVMHEEGRGVLKDDAAPAGWFGKAAAQGHVKAQVNLGVMHEEGRGVPQGDGEAANWYRKAAEQGDAGGQNNLGYMYNEGRGAPQDLVLAHMWVSLAAEQGHENAVVNRAETAKVMTPDQIAEARQMAREWMAGHQQ